MIPIDKITAIYTDISSRDTFFHSLNKHFLVFSKGSWACGDNMMISAWVLVAWTICCTNSSLKNVLKTLIGEVVSSGITFTPGSPAKLKHLLLVQPFAANLMRCLVQHACLHKYWLFLYPCDMFLLLFSHLDLLHGLK